MFKSSLLSLSLCFLVLAYGCLAQAEQQQCQGQHQQQQQRRVRGRSECRVQSLSALEPARRIESEAGVTEFWDESNEQFQCAGRGIQGTMIPGCPETFQSFQQSQEGRSTRFNDHHQKIQSYRQGDIIALPAGVAHWCYNDGETPLIAVSVLDTSNYANQLDQNPRKFYLAGNPRQQQQQQQQQGGSSYHHQQTQQERSGKNIFSGFDVNILAEAFDVSTETARKLQSENDNRGNIVHVKNGLQNAIMAPHWNLNAHSVIYVTKGNGRIQVVGNYKQAVFDGELRQGQLLIVPQNFAIVKQAGNDGFEWVSFKTNDNAMSSPLTGRFSVIRGMPEEVLVNAYRISRADARNLKYNREEMVVFGPRSESQERASA
ncbi:hypothetical protein HHK36_022531 [Tetracentron sinense]|uniref:Cupin type-1 domain-containing protein n=1 Tax=Tetracentron sinense TaxID=13715 RepID=A0A834YN41_TETSI|nr:hypothetical protein HHK36_022531 [Tetracentron sinense]